MKLPIFVRNYVQAQPELIVARSALTEVSLFVLGIFLAVMTMSVFAASLPDNGSLMYPLQEVSKLTCRQIEWTQVPAECKIVLPRIKGGTYGSYISNKEHTDIYNVLYKGSYEGEKWNQIGSHVGVDISTSNGTPVYAIADGVVYDAKFQAGYGNVIKVQFKYKGTTYYAVYAHLSEISVAKGAAVKKGQSIGKVGNTGVSNGAMGGFHLHFEIDKDDKGKPTYAFRECPEWQMGSNETEVVNKGLCRDKLEARTVDPISFLEQAGATIQGTVNSEQGTEKPVNTTTVVTNPVETKPAEVKPLVVTPAGSPEVQVATIDKKLLSANARTFVDENTFSVKSTIVNPLAIGKEGTLTLSAVGKNGVNYNGALPVPIEIVAGSNKVTISPASVGLLQGSTTIKVTGKAVGEDVVTLRYDGQLFAKVAVNVAGDGNVIADTHGTAPTTGKYKCRALANKEKMFF